MNKHHQHRADRSRKGSVLLFVVALLMLLGLMGMSYLFNVRMDRTHLSSTVGAVGGAWPTIDLASTDDTVKNLIATTILNDLFTPNATTPTTSAYRAFSAAGYPSSYTDYDDPQTKTWLAGHDPVNTDSTGTTGTTAKWEWVSGPLTVNGTASYSSPKTGGSTSRQGLNPSYVKIYYDPATVTSPKAIIGKTRNFPSLDGSTLDADADGDGIADSKLQLLDPSAQPTYVGSRPVKIYFAVRIVDNCAAVNVNTAYSRSGFGGTGYLQALLGTFRSDVGLKELLQDTTNSTTEINNLNSVRYPSGLSNTPSSGSGFSYINGADAAENEVARCIYKPGGPALDNSGIENLKAIRFRAGLMRPNPSQETLETQLNYDAWYNSPDYHQNASTIIPYFPCVTTTTAQSGGTDFWYNLTYNFDNGTSGTRTTFFNNSTPAVPATPPQSIRDFLVTQNPVANVAPGHDMTTLKSWAPFIPWVDSMDWYSGVVNADPDPLNYNPNLMPDSANGNYVRKACVNTATFGELWRAYWNIFADDADPTLPSATPADLSIRQCRYSPSNILPGDDWSWGGSTFTDWIGVKCSWTTREQMLLRSACAAINTLQERAGANSPILSRQISIPLNQAVQVDPGFGSFLSYFVTVYGAKKQPYITKVFLQRSHPEFGFTAVNYLAIELYNPYSTPIVMTNWKLALATYQANDPSFTFTSDGSLDIPVNGTVPAGGYLVLTMTGSSAPPATVPPPNVSVHASLPDLGSGFLDSITAIGPGQKPSAPISSKIYLMRPRLDGTVSTSTATTASPNGPYGENYSYDENNVSDMVPVDMIDVALQDLTDQGVDWVDQWVYARPTGAASSFQCVYYGPYDLGATPRTGWLTQNYNNAQVPTAGQSPVTLGQDDHPGGWASAFAIQLGNFTPVNPITNGNNAFPFGGFARDGDILRVPFIAHYRIQSNKFDDAYKTWFTEMNTVTLDSWFAESSSFTTAPSGADAKRQVGRFCPRPDTGGTITDYDFANRLFSYLTAIQNPDDATSPNVNAFDYTSAGNTPPATVSNNGYNGVHGKININTASWKVLSMLPLVVNGGNVDVMATENLAKAIVADRQPIANGGHGPYTSIFDLNRVKDSGGNYIFRNAATEGSFAKGDLYPDTAIGDFKNTYLELARLSNLLTVRSDSFTVYVVVQAWQDYGTSTPVLLNERRTAWIIDRSTVNNATTLSSFLSDPKAMTQIVTQ